MGKNRVVAMVCRLLDKCLNYCLLLASRIVANDRVTASV